MGAIYDFDIVQTPSLILVTPQTDGAREFVRDHIPDDATYLGDAVAVESRYIADLTDGILDNGLTVEKDGMEMYRSDGEFCLRAKCAAA